MMGVITRVEKMVMQSSVKPVIEKLHGTGMHQGCYNDPINPPKRQVMSLCEHQDGKELSARPYSTDASMKEHVVANNRRRNITCFDWKNSLESKKEYLEVAKGCPRPFCKDSRNKQYDYQKKNKMNTHIYVEILDGKNHGQRRKDLLYRRGIQGGAKVLNDIQEPSY